MTSRKTRFPAYDVLSKVASPSWDDVTRAVVGERMCVPNKPHFFDETHWSTVCALCECIIPQAKATPIVPLPEMLDANLTAGIKDGFRDARLLPPPQAWCIGLDALNAECEAAYGRRFADAGLDEQNALLERVQQGDAHHPAWQGMPPAHFFSARLLPDICGAYYAHPHAWSAIGFGGPANPRGYVRLYFNRKDPWEAAEAAPGKERSAPQENKRVK